MRTAAQAFRYECIRRAKYTPMPQSVCFVQAKHPFSQMNFIQCIRWALHSSVFGGRAIVFGGPFECIWRAFECIRRERHSSIFGGRFCLHSNHYASTCSLCRNHAKRFSKSLTRRASIVFGTAAACESRKHAHFPSILINTVLMLEPIKKVASIKRLAPVPQVGHFVSNVSNIVQHMYHKILFDTIA